MQFRLAAHASEDGLAFARAALLLCVFIIVYSSLLPFEGWRLPQEVSFRAIQRGFQTGFDLILNVAAYFPPGLLLAHLLYRRGARYPLLTAALGASALSAVLESVQLFLPGRVTALHDWLANSAGGLLGAGLAVSVYGQRIAQRLVGVRRRWLAAPAHAEIGALLMLLWFTTQSNPGVPFFEAGSLINQLTRDWQADALDPLFLVPQVVAIALNVCGFVLLLGVFVVPRIFAGVPAALLLGAGLLMKFLAAGLMLKAPLLGSWFGPSTVLGLLAGYFLALILLGFRERTRLLLALTLVFAGGLMSKMAGSYASNAAMLSVFYWPHGQLGTFNSVTRWLNELWPVAALGYLAWVFFRTTGKDAAAQ